MTEFLNWLNGEIIWGPPLIALIIITGIYMTVRSGFFQVCHLGYIFKTDPCMHPEKGPCHR